MAHIRKKGKNLKYLYIFLELIYTWISRFEAFIIDWDYLL